VFKVDVLRNVSPFKKEVEHDLRESRSIHTVALSCRFADEGLLIVPFYSLTTGDRQEFPIVPGVLLLIMALLNVIKYHQHVYSQPYLCFMTVMHTVYIYQKD
jgi:hypothetical protein